MCKNKNHRFHFSERCSCCERRVCRAHKLFVTNVQHSSDDSNGDWMMHLLKFERYKWNCWHQSESLYDVATLYYQCNGRCFALILTQINKIFQLLCIIRDLADISCEINWLLHSFNVQVMLWIIEAASKMDWTNWKQKTQIKSLAIVSPCHRAILLLLFRRMCALTYLMRLKVRMTTASDAIL